MRTGRPWSDEKVVGLANQNSAFCILHYNREWAIPGRKQVKSPQTQPILWQPAWDLSMSHMGT
jgi:hypothetical protein